jgi:sec-independent protein translocase protein TatA
MMTNATLAVFGIPGGWEWILIALIALLIFGGRLPNVARSVGKSIVEFRKGLHDVKSEIEAEDTRDKRMLPEGQNGPNAAGSQDRPSAQTGQTSTPNDR